MKVEPWELSIYETAARAVCSKLNIDPESAVESGDGTYYPQWIDIAFEMHKFRLMESALRDYGPCGPV